MSIERSEAQKGLRLRIAAMLVGLKVLQEGESVFNSGLPSPIKIESDVLRRPEFESVHEEICLHLANLIEEETGESPDVVVAVLTGADSFARVVADYKDCRVAARLGNSDTPEKRKLIHGEIHKGDKVVIIEDVFTTGKNTLKTKEYVEAEGGEVVLAASIFDYEFEECRKNFDQAELPHASLTNLNTSITCVADQEFREKIEYWRDNIVPAFFASTSSA